MTAALAGRTAVVVCEHGAVADALVAGLDRAGSTAERVEPSLTSAAEVAAAFERCHPDVVVHVQLGVAEARDRAVVEMSEQEWAAQAELPVRAALWVAQAAFSHLRGRDGRLVFVGPTTGMEGAAGLVPLATAAEAVRVLAKSAARRWGRDGITVNTVATSLTVLGASAATTRDAGRSSPALAGEGLDGVVGAVVWLAGAGSAAITGATIGADNGALMAP